MPPLSNILIFFTFLVLELGVVKAYITWGVDISPQLDIFFGLITIVILGALLFTQFGYLGPSQLRNRMRSVVRWQFKDTSLFLPMDPYKPTKETFKEGIQGFWPTKSRFKNYLILLFIGFIVVVVLKILGLSIY